MMQRTTEKAHCFISTDKPTGQPSTDAVLVDKVNKNCPEAACANLDLEHIGTQRESFIEVILINKTHCCFQLQLPFIDKQRSGSVQQIERLGGVKAEELCLCVVEVNGVLIPRRAQREATTHARAGHAAVAENRQHPTYRNQSAPSLVVRTEAKTGLGIGDGLQQEAV